MGLDESREGGENDLNIAEGDFEERNELDHLEEGPLWDDDRRRAEEARRERGRHEQNEREYPMTNYFGSATPGECQVVLHRIASSVVRCVKSASGHVAMLLSVALRSNTWLSGRGHSVVLH